MLPRDQGGVVDANLRVYGLANVRVADASVPPIALSTHLMASTYGVAEQASNIIRSHWNEMAKAPTQPQPAYSTSRPSVVSSSSSSSSSGPSSGPSSVHSSSGNTGISGSGKAKRPSGNGGENGSADLLRGWRSLPIVAAHLVLALKLSV